MFKEYSDYDGLGLARLIAEGRVSQTEVLQAAALKLEQWNPTLNAVVHHQQPNEDAIGVVSGSAIFAQGSSGEQAGQPSTASCAPMGTSLALRFWMVNRFLASGLRDWSNQHSAAGDLWCDGVEFRGVLILEH